MKECPEGKDTCPCLGFSKDGLCDWPYRSDMDREQIHYMSELLRTIEEKSREHQD